MGPRHKLRWLAVLALAGACTFGVVASSQASRRPGCGSGWAASAGRAGSLDPGSGPAVRVSHSRSGWRVDLRNDGGHAITGVVSASARVTSLRTTRTIGRALRRGARGFSFALGGRTAGQRITFKLACARRITFTFSGLSVVLGAHHAPTASFALSRPAQSGVAGRLIAGPTCPVVRPSCPPGPAVPGTVTINTAPSSRDSGPGTFVKSVPSDSHGNFATDLPPGNYVLSAQSSGAQQGAPAGGSSQSVPVSVESGVISQVLLAFDTGIR